MRKSYIKFVAIPLLFVAGYWILPSRAADNPWTLVAGIESGQPSGWVQVRENSIQGSRLGYQHDLGVSRVPSEDLSLQYAMDSQDFWRFTLKSLSFNGSAVPANDVQYNGTTLAAGHPLSATTHFPDYMQFSALRGWRMHGPDNLSFWCGGGLSYTAITFYLDGTITANSVGHETKEDFVTQELPVPMVAIGFSKPLADGWSVVSSLDVAFLPWVNSLRHEGDVVRLNQAQMDLTAGLHHAVTRDAGLTLSAYYRYYHQHEQSGEDDNNLLFETRGLRIEADYHF